MREDDIRKQIMWFGRRDEIENWGTADLQPIIASEP